MTDTNVGATSAKDEFYNRVAARFGITPNFFRSAAAAPGLIEELWGFAESAYFQNPLPSLFKERLFVHLSRFCRARYCIVRHVGFLLGFGHAAGDPKAVPQSTDEVIALLRRPAVLPPAEIELAFSRLEAAGPLSAIPEPGAPLEHDLFLAASAVFLVSTEVERARAALRAALGERNAELLLAYLAFIRTAHYWTETHPEIVVEDDMQALMRDDQTLQQLLCSTADAEAGELSRPLHDEMIWPRRERQLALQQSEEQFKRLVQSVTDYAIFMLDPTGIVANWNPGARRIKGYKPQEIIGQHFSIFYSPEDRESGVPTTALETAARVGHWENEGWRYRKDGDRFWASVTIERIIGDDGQVAGFAKITRDMTDRREAQIALEKANEAAAQSQKLEALGQLTSGIAHDFNNLLTAILGSLELLGKRLPPEPRLKQLLNNAFEGARRGAALTHRMLAFARRSDLSLDTVNVGKLVVGMTGLIQRSVGPHVKIETDVSPDLPAIKADPTQLENAILNLCVNARDAMPHGGSIQIHARFQDGEGVMGSSALPHGCVVVSVIDDGAGMDDATRQRATEPFFTTKELGKGTGLGLSMVHGMTEQLGGRVRIDSELGQGTTIELWLPATNDQALPEAELLTLESVGPTARKLLIVAVEDDSLVLANIVGMLEEDGHTVLEASTGAHALDLIRKSAEVDLVITDQAMPQMTGMQLAAAIRVEWPEMPILLVSGNAELPSADPLRIPKLAKPYSHNDLRLAINVTMASEVTGNDVLGSTYRP